jgi:hypothetical protein
MILNSFKFVSMGACRPSIQALVSIIRLIRIVPEKRGQREEAFYGILFELNELY